VRAPSTRAPFKSKPIAPTASTRHHHRISRPPPIIEHNAGGQPLLIFGPRLTCSSSTRQPPRARTRLLCIIRWIRGSSSALGAELSRLLPCPGPPLPRSTPCTPSLVPPPRRHLCPHRPMCRPPGRHPHQPTQSIHHRAP
jgi:hypothetical protein